MEIEAKQRSRRRKRAQRMQKERRDRGLDESEPEDARPKKPPPRPTRRKKKELAKEPLCEEDVVDGFAILQFRSYEDLELVLKISTKENIKRLTDIERPKLEPKAHITNHILVHNNHGLTVLGHDPATSDDSGRASERLTGSSVAPRDADSSRDRLSDASSRCSSGKGYICDSEGEDDKGSDASSVIFASAPASRKHELPGALPPGGVPAGGAASPVPAPTPPHLPAPSPAPAQQPALPPPSAVTQVPVGVEHKERESNVARGPVVHETPLPPKPIQQPALPPPTTIISQQPHATPVVAVAAVPTDDATIPAAAPAPVSLPSHHPTAPLDSTRTESPAVATSTAAPPAPAQFHHPYPPLYAPYAPVTATDKDKARQPTPPVSREKESYNVSSLSRSSVAPAVSAAPAVAQAPQPAQPALSKPWQAPASSPAPAPPRPAPAAYAAPPLFAAPAPPPVSAAAPMPAPPPANPNPFSAESLFQTNQADMLRRELDNRFLASQDRTLGVAPPPYLRTEMHQHQHHHTHVHQHTTSLLPPPSASTLFPSQLPLSPMERLARRSQSSFKDIPKLGGVESPFYRQNIGMPNYPTYAPGLLSHHSLTTGPTPFVPPNHLPTFAPKKTGKWNAMHVRVAWEIYHHQQKSGEAKGSIAAAKGAADLLRPPTHLFSPSVHASRGPHEMSPFPSMAAHRPPAFDQPHHHGSLFSSPASHLGKSPFTSTSSISPFTRYGGAPLSSSSTSPFSVSPFGPARDAHLGLSQMHDPWRSLPRAMPGFPPAVNPLPPSLPVVGLPPPAPAPWTIKPDPVLEQREREAREREERERERLRREREERERREREEKQRRLEQQQQQERERERREKERREMERREMEKREREREIMLHQQRLAESAKQLPPPVIRDRSPLRNGQVDLTEIRVKEEPRTKEEDLLVRADHRYHPFLRHASALPPPPPVLDRTRVIPHALPPHYPPAGHWPPPPSAADPFYRYGYPPLMDDRAGFFGSPYGHHQLRPKDPALLQLRGGPGPPPPPLLTRKVSATPPGEVHKKEEPR